MDTSEVIVRGGIEDHRSGPRHEYQYRQWIAPLSDGAMPAPGEFFTVECVDLSTGGMAFVMPERPKFERLVVALGPRSRPTYVTARVVHVACTPQPSGAEYRVGCRFLERVNR